MFNVKCTDSTPGILEGETLLVSREDNRYYYFDGYDCGYLKLFFEVV